MDDLTIVFIIVILSYVFRWITLNGSKKIEKIIELEKNSLDENKPYYLILYFILIIIPGVNIIGFYLIERKRNELIIKHQEHMDLRRRLIEERGRQLERENYWTNQDEEKDDNEETIGFKFNF
jgi:hypothetical protein